MLNPFGAITNVVFDWGTDSLDRAIMAKMLDKPRVYKLLSKDSSTTQMVYDSTYNVKKHVTAEGTVVGSVTTTGNGGTSTQGGSQHPHSQHKTKKSSANSYKCLWCGKTKYCSDGYYQKLKKNMKYEENTYRACLQCAASQAETQLNKFEKRTGIKQDDTVLKELLLGQPPFPLSMSKTALCVFASQRQASKCVYVRSRLAYNGAFATHYHHYSKLKKEIAMSLEPKYKVLKPAKRPKQDRHKSKHKRSMAKDGDSNKNKGKGKSKNSRNKGNVDKSETTTASNSSSSSSSSATSDADTSVQTQVNTNLNDDSGNGNQTSVDDEKKQKDGTNDKDKDGKKKEKKKGKKKESFEKYSKKGAPRFGSTGIATAPVYGLDGVPLIQPHEPAQVINAEKVSMSKHGRKEKGSKSKRKHKERSKDKEKEKEKEKEKIESSK